VVAAETSIFMEENGFSQSDFIGTMYQRGTSS